MQRLALVASLFLIAAAPFHWFDSDDDYFAIRKNFEIFGSIYEDLVLEYVDEVDAERLMRAGIEAMLKELDPYTVFFDEATNEQIDIAVRGKTGSPGISVGSISGNIVVLAPENAAGGYKQGIRTGDVIISIDGTSLESLTSADARNMLYGEPGSVVEVIVQRSGAEDLIPFTLLRERVRYNSVSYAGSIENESRESTAYIKLARFGKGASTEVRNALDSLVSPTTNGVILDLRDNPGGLLGEAVGIVSLFVPSGTPVVSTIGRTTQTDQLYKSSGRPLYEGKLIVLINEISASASEIVAGALQDHDRAVVMGTRSFGKGLVQVIKELPFNTSLKITTSRYYIPSGRSIQNVLARTASTRDVPRHLMREFKTDGGRIVFDGAGIEPDINAGNENEAEVVQALKRRSAFFEFANHYRDTGATADESFTVTDSLFLQFQDWLEDRNFVFETNAERQLKNVRLAFEAGDYSTSTLDEVEERLVSEKRIEVQRREAQIKPYLYREILGRYLDDRTYTRTTTNSDELVLQSLSLATDPERFSQILAQ
ncbi:MAG: S41 family peptidase [Rhodothermales bacterium]|nr:S41 family peptidase [Rhodothermales bacterium]